MNRYRLSALLLLFVPLLCACAIGVSRLCFPFDTGHFESGIWAPALLSATGRNPYAPELSDHAPYVMAPYGPAYYLFIGVGLRVFGEQFWFGRAVSLLSALVVLGCLLRVLWLWTRDRRATVLGGALFCAALPTQYWVAMQRPDFVALALAWVGLTLVIAPPRRLRLHTQASVAPSPRGILLVATLQVLALGCRPTTFLPLLASCAWLCLARQGRQAWALLLTSCGLLSGVVWWLNASSRGGYVWQQFVLAGSISKSWQRTFDQLTFMALAPVTWLTLGLILLALWPSLRGQKGAANDAPILGAEAGQVLPPPWVKRFLHVYLLLAVLLAGLTASRRGSNLNYWLEPCVVAALVGATGWFQWARATSRGHEVVGRRWAQCALILTSSALLTGAIVSQNEVDHWKSLAYFNAVTDTVKRIVPPGESGYSHYPDFLVRAGRPYLFNDEYQYEHGQPRQRQIFADVVRARRLAVLIWQRPEPLEGYRRIVIPVPHSFSVAVDVRADLLSRYESCQAGDAPSPIKWDSKRLPPGSRK